MVYVSNKLKRKLKNIRNNDDGQALTEFALVVPLLIMLAIGILLLGYFIYCHIIVVSAANQGARAGSALIADPEITPYEASLRARQTANTLLSNGLNINYGEVNVSQSDSFDVTVNYKFNFPISLPGLPRSHTISYTASYMIWGDT